MQWPWSKREKKPKVEPHIPDGAIRLRLTYTGRVQAVGFRFTVDGCASEAHITGWVRNMEDGSVLVEAQGTSEQVQDFKRLVQEAIDDPRTFIQGGLSKQEAIECKPETRFSILNL